MADQKPLHPVDLAPKINDEVRQTTCYMCACRCGIDVHIQDNKVRYIAGNPNHPVNKGVLCAKGSAGIMQHNSPARLRKPLLRVGERGEGKFKEISWDEAMQTATSWLAEVREKDPNKLAFFTGRDQSQSLTGWWAKQYGTINHAAHGGFCSVNMAAAGLYTIGGSFWEFGEPDWERTNIFLMFGVAEDHDSNPIKIGLGRLKTRGAKFISINPVRTGYSAIADEWIGIKPGTDGLLVGGLIHQLLKTEQIDWQFLGRTTNACWLVIDAPDTDDHGMFARDGDGNVLVWDLENQAPISHETRGVQPAMSGNFTLPDGQNVTPAFHLLARRFLAAQYAPNAVAEQTGLPASRIISLAGELADAAFAKSETLNQPWEDWQGTKHKTINTRGVSIHAMRGISAHANGFHTCRMIHVLQSLLGTVDAPGGFLYKPPFPKSCPPGPKPAGPASAPGETLGGMPLGFPTAPHDLLVDDQDQPLRIDKAFSWDFPLAVHGMMHMVLHNAWAGDPYKIDLLFMYMANMGWNSAMNLADTHKYLTDRDTAGNYKIPRLIYSDAYHSEMVAYADLILPDTTYLERWDCISLLDRPISSAHGPGDSIRQPIIAPDRDVRPFQDVLIDLGARLQMPGFVNDAGDALYSGGYSDYIVNHERTPGIGPLAGWRGEKGDQHGRGAKNPDQLKRYIENGCFWQDSLPPDQRYMRHSNGPYLQYAKKMGWIPQAKPVIIQLYSETLQSFRLAAEGRGPNPAPIRARARISQYFDPLPFWYPVPSSKEGGEYPLHAITQRPMHMYHSWGSQNAWLRQITTQNRLFIATSMAQRLALQDDDWVWIISRIGKVRAQIATHDGVNENTVWTWNAIGKRRGHWGLSSDAPESNQGFLLNHIIPDRLQPDDDGREYSNADPVTGQAAWFDLRVRIEKCQHQDDNLTYPLLPAVQSQGTDTPILQYGKQWGATHAQPNKTLAGDIYSFVGNNRARKSEKGAD